MRSAGLEEFSLTNLINFQDRKDSIPEEAEAALQQSKNVTLAEVSEEIPAATGTGIGIAETSSKHSSSDGDLKETTTTT